MADKTITIPLVGNFDLPLVKSGSGDGGSIIYKGQQFINCVFNLSNNQVTRTASFSVEKRPGIANSVTKGSGTITDILCPAFSPTDLYYGGSSTSWDGGTTPSAVGAVYGPSYTLGQVSGSVKHLTETIIGGYQTICVNSTDGTAYYYPIGLSVASATSFSGTTSTGAATITGISSTAGFIVGQGIQNISSFPANTYVVSIDSGTQITVSNNATSTGSTTLYQMPLVKIMDSDFPSATAVGAFAFLDGYAFIMTTDGRVYNSALNSISSWGAADYITANMDSDGGVGCVRYKNQIIAFGTNSGEPLYNAGNPSGSVLSRSEGAFFKIGALSSYGITSIEDTIYWVGVSAAGGLAVYVLEGYTPRKISTPEIDSIINAERQQSSAVYDVRAARLTGKNCIFVTPSSAVSLNGLSSAQINSLVFDIEMGLWHGWGAAQSATAIRFNKLAFSLNRSAIIFGGTGGATHICRFGHGAFQKDQCSADENQTGGYAFTMNIRTRTINFGTNNRKTIKRVQLNCDQFFSGSVGFASYNVNEFGNLSNTVSGTFDITQANPQIYRFGSFVGSKFFSLTHSDASTFRAESITFDISIGVH